MGRCPTLTASTDCPPAPPRRSVKPHFRTSCEPRAEPTAYRLNLSTMLSIFHLPHFGVEAHLYLGPTWSLNLL
jgi:hypothetical protein